MATSQPTEQQIKDLVPQRDLSPGFQAMIGRVIADPEFRKALAADPVKALADAKIELSAEEMERIRTMTPEDRKKLTQELDTRDSKAWWIVIWHWFSWW
ncbi:MAG TPA: Os1348 family NHLP clan protein [Chloroflexota bacterium]|nr:Os1348 family NHLP clan protein [Chloroflexota bacterium]